MTFTRIFIIDKLRLISILVVYGLGVGCQDNNQATPVPAQPYTSDRGTFSYYIRGAIHQDQSGTADFYRAGTHVVILFDSRSAPKRLELAYEETRMHHTGIFPVVQEQDPGGFLMLYKHFEENYWQREGIIEITHSGPDTIKGRMDRVLLDYVYDEATDSIRQVEVTGHFEAY